MLGFQFAWRIASWRESLSIESRVTSSTLTISSLDESCWRLKNAGWMEARVLELALTVSLMLHRFSRSMTGSSSSSDTMLIQLHRLLGISNLSHKHQGLDFICTTKLKDERSFANFKCYLGGLLLLHPHLRADCPTGCNWKIRATYQKSRRRNREWWST
jgi:hypothetical protein